MASSRKGKSREDWRRPAGEDTSIKALQELWLPFKVNPEQTDTVPAEWRGNAFHLMTPQQGVPFTGYYAPFRLTKIAVTNVYGVWFEFCYCEGEYEAHRLAQAELHLPLCPLSGIQMRALEESGEGPTRAPTLHKQPEKDAPMPPLKP